MTLKLLKSFLKYITIFIVALIAILLCFYLYLISGSTKQGDITWHSCYRPAYWSWFILPPPTSLQCATLSVPVDYVKPDGKHFVIPLTRLPATGDDIIGDLLLLSGGPGGHSLDMSTTMGSDEYSQAIKERFHILGYAPRGVKPSTPAIDCGGVEEEGNAKAYMDACIQHTGTDILPFVSSKEVVMDLDSIRQALQNDTWSMVGYSYGTKLVAKYAEHYPKALRAGVADGVVDTAEDLETILFNQQKHAQIAFDGFMKSCQAPCVFDKNKEPNQAFLDTLNTIAQKDLKDKDGKVIDQKALIGVFGESMNDESAWQTMHQMFDELIQGNTDTYDFEKLIAKIGEKSFSSDALSIINCADSAPKLDKDDYIKSAKAIDNQSQFDNYKTRPDDEYLDSCYYWQWTATDDLNENLVNDDTPNLLFVSYEYDLATPLPNAMTMAKKFDDPLIVLSGQYGHTVSLFGTNACVDDYVSRYLLDPKSDFGDKLLFCAKP
ncbi:Tripeptidyl aminopeptidase precursor [Moraxella caprae]|uniref:Proline iminopeptidase n=1 Tax=Moraxella caprae TaxID=90240 RepID=A0A378R4A4_9GAMM|nr:alpha/beta fold hydrolase [Moraxella caprae]STZ09619.1 Tripeptidyl aminopeptidase precursor [Moraxella caprae]